MEAPKGSLIAGQFLAPGPDGLEEAIKKIRDILHEAQGRKISSIEAYDMVMWIASAVLSGGVRRSAVIVQFSFDDELMMNAKIGEWWKENPQRALSNNSATLIRGKFTPDDVRKIIRSTVTTTLMLTLQQLIIKEKK